MGIGVEECGQRAGRYVSIFARAACGVQLALGEFQRIAIIKPGEFWRQTTG
jgi:hypothetical protein